MKHPLMSRLSELVGKEEDMGEASWRGQSDESFAENRVEYSGKKYETYVGEILVLFLFTKVVEEFLQRSLMCNCAIIMECMMGCAWKRKRICKCIHGACPNWIGWGCLGPVSHKKPKRTQARRAMRVVASGAAERVLDPSKKGIQSPNSLH